MNQKKIFQLIFLVLVILLVSLPFILTFNDFFTHALERISWYNWIQDRIVPFEVRIVAFLTSIFGIHIDAYTNGMMVKGVFLKMSWNCIGWQSLLLLGITMFFGLKNASYTLVSQLQTVLIGILGIFFINIFRLTFIVLLFAYLRPLYGIVYHDYLAAIVTTVYLFVFWWFAYTYVLENKAVTY